MTEGQDSKESQSDAGGKIFTNKSKDKKSKLLKPFTKIIIRRLPPTMSGETFLEQVSPIPEYDYFYYAKPDPTLLGYSRAYINFVNVDDLYLFRDKFDGYIFLDDKGVEYVSIVEFAPFQRIPKKKKKKDPKCNTIESDPVYQEFLDSLNEQETETQPKLEYSYPVSDGNDKKAVSTPLLDYLAARKLDKRNRDDRRRRENDKRKLRILKSKDGTIKEEEDDADLKKGKPLEWESKSKTKDEPSRSPGDEDTGMQELKNYRDQRKAALEKRKKYDEKSPTKGDDADDDKFKETRAKKYSESRRERKKQLDALKTDKEDDESNNKPEVKVKTINQDDIKPFTQLPQVKTDDLINVIKLMEEMDKKMKLEENETKKENLKPDKEARITTKVRRNSSEVVESKNDHEFNRQNSLDDSSREDSVEKDRDGADRRSEKRIRNKDRPSLVIYQPGMGKFSKQRLAKEKDTHSTAKVNDSEKRDT